MARKEFRVTRWKRHTGAGYSRTNSPGFNFWIETDSEFVGEGKRKKYYTVYLATDSNIYKFWFYQLEEKGQDGLYHAMEMAPEMSDFLKRYIEADEIETKTRQSLNNGSTIESIDWESREITYDNFYELDSLKQYTKWKPFDVVVNSKVYSNEFGNRFEEVGLIVRFENMEARAIFHLELLFTNTGFERDLYENDIDQCPKDWWWNTHCFVTLTNKVIKKRNRYCYFEEWRKSMIDEKLLLN